MKFKVICVNNNINNSKIKVNQYYIAEKDIYLAHGKKKILYSVYNLKEEFIGGFHKSMFKTIKQIRNERINKLI